MADSYDQAQSALEQQRRDYLAAMAQAGSQGAQEFTSAQADIQNQKAQAVQQALAAAAGAPQQLRDQIAQQVGSPYDRRVSDLTSSNASRSSSFGANQAAGDTVIQQAIANIPALRAMSQRQAQAEQFKAQQQAQQDDLAMQLKNVDLQIAQKNLEKSQGDGSGDPLGDLLKQINIKQKIDEMNLPQQHMNVLGDAQQHLGGTGSNGYRLLEGIIGNPKVKGYNDAMAALGGAYAGEDGAPSVKTPHGGILDRGVIESYLARYYGS